MTKKLLEMLDKEIVEIMGIWKFGPFQKVTTWVASQYLLARCKSKAIIGNLVDESKRISKEAGVPWHKIFVSQYIYDFSQAASAKLPSACTVGVAKTKDGKTAFVRCMDWAVPPGIGAFTETTETRDGQKVTGFPGFLGTVTAVGNGLAFAMNQSPSDGIYIGGIPTCYFAELLRKDVVRSLKRSSLTMACHSVAIRIGRSKEFRPMSPCSFLFANDEDYCVMEIVPSRMPDKEIGSVALKHGKVKNGAVLANHFVTKTNAKCNPEVFEVTDEDGRVWSNDTLERAEAMKAILKVVKKKKSSDLQSITQVMGEPVINELTANLTIATTDLKSFDVYWK